MYLVFCSSRAVLLSAKEIKMKESIEKLKKCFYCFGEIF